MTGLRVLANLFLPTRQFLSAFAVGFLLFGLFGAAPPTARGQVLSLVWSDEFNSATSSNLDTTKWTYDTGNNNGWGNNEFEFYTKRTNNAYVAGGLLHIHAQIENTNSVSHSVTNTYRYTSARIKTQGLFNALYGRIEWRAKLPAGVGMWPALWMMGSNSVSVSWPGCGEIDVVENDGSDVFFVQGSIHSGTDATEVYDFTGGNSVTNFHVYDLDWTSNSITWSVDGTAYETQTSWGTDVSGQSYPYPFNQPFYLIMNLAVGGDYVGDPTTNSINPSLPAELQVDYVRVFQSVYVPTPLILSITPNKGCAAGGTAVTIGGANFQNGSTITIFGVNTTSVTWVNSNTLTAVTGANSREPTASWSRLPGKPPTTLTNGFTYASPPDFGRTEQHHARCRSRNVDLASAFGTAPFTYGVYEATNSGRGRSVRC